MGDIEDGIHVRPASLFGREHDPKGPRKILGPSTALVDPGCVKAEEGVTVSNATWPCNIIVGARYENNESRSAVSISTGVKYRMVPFEISASMVEQVA
jgi:hypothetical protein